MKNTAILLLLVISASFSAVTNLKAEFRGGKTFITFTEDANAAIRYNLYRSESAISTLTGLTPLVNLAAGTGRDPNFGTYHTIKDMSAPLTAGTGLFVYTPKAVKSAYYAVTTVNGSTEDKTLNSGINVLTAPVAEAYWKAPLGVITQLTDSASYMFYYWMDYSTWPNSQEYYGNYFHLIMDLPVKSMKNVPLYVYLHALNSGTGMPEATTYGNTYSLRTNDPNNTWWFGTGSDNYTERRLLAYIDAVIGDPRFSVDTNRVYLRGQSMGGKGTMTNGLHFPDRFAALIPFLAPIDNTMTALLTANPGKYFPPITDFFGSKDSYADFGMGGHRMLYMACAAARQGVWGNWMAVGHQPAGDPNVLVKGSFLRFRKDEIYPAFTHSDKDWNYGLTNPNVYDSIGLINAYFDWSSSLHRLTLNKDSLIDCADSISLTITSPYVGTLTDITPRNTQRFRPVKGKTYTWRNIDVAKDTVTTSGSVVADANSLITLLSVSVCKTGNRLIIKDPSPAAIEGALPQSAGMASLQAFPNPFRPTVRFSLPNGSGPVRIFSADGKLVATLSSSGKELAQVNWHADRLPAGTYIARVACNGRELSRKLILLK